MQQPIQGQGYPDRVRWLMGIMYVRLRECSREYLRLRLFVRIEALRRAHLEVQGHPE